MKLLPSFRYATLVWLTGLLGFPALFVLYATLYSGGVFMDSLYGDRWDLPGLVRDIVPWTIPSWLIFIWATHHVCKRQRGKWEKKWALFGVGLMLIILPSAIVNGPSEFIDTAFLMLFYWVPALLGIFLYRLPAMTAQAP